MNKNKYYSLIVLVLCLIILSACDDKENKSINSEKDITNFIQDKNYETIYTFINNNTHNGNEQSLVKTAVQSLAKTNDHQNDAFLEEFFKRLISNKDWDTTLFYIHAVENDDNSYTVNRIIEEIETYESEKETIGQLKEEMNQLIEQRELLIEQYPYQIPLDYTVIHNFQGVILQKLSDMEYRVIGRYTTSDKEYILRTVKTAFTSAGQFAMYVLPGEEESYQLANGFSEMFQILYEIPQENVDAVIAINEVTKQINDLSNKMNEDDQLKGYHIGNLNDLIEDIFEMKNVQKQIKNAEKGATDNETKNEIIYIQDNKFYINGLTLQDDKQTIITKLGEPNSEEVGEAGPLESTLFYDNMYFSLYDDKAYWIEIDIDKELIDELLKTYTGEKYLGQSGEIFFSESQTEQLLILGQNYEGVYQASLTYIDGNFTANVENGYYQRVED